jgi:hypothetical protein
MNEAEAKQVAAVLATADRGCPNCAMDIAEEAERLIPGHPWKRLVTQAFGKPLWMDVPYEAEAG